MSVILQSLGRTVLAGFVLLALLVLLASQVLFWPMAPIVTILIVFSHVACGVMWVGLLWYFNFVQIPSMPQIPDEQKPAISKVIAPRALFWFRYAALATVVTGLFLAYFIGYSHLTFIFMQEGSRAIGLGMWLALIMAFNVWFIIWPNQKKALGLVVVEAAAKAKAARTAMLTSRINTMLSIPMLLCMVAPRWGGF